MKRVLLVVLAMLLGAPQVHGDTRPGIKARFTGLVPSRAGVPLTAQVELTAPQPMTLKQFAIAVGEAPVGSNAPTDSMVLAPNSPQTITFTAIPFATGDGVTFSFQSGSERYVFKRDLSQQWIDGRHYGQTVGFNPQPDPPVTPGSELLLVAPEVPWFAPDESPYGRPVITAEQAARHALAMGVNAIESHHLSGSLRYERPDLVQEPVDGATYVIWQKGPAGDLPVGFGVTTADGRYDKVVNVNTALGRTFYLSYQATNTWVHVLNNDDDDDAYRFRTLEFTGPVGGGSTTRSMLAQHERLFTPALHMLSTITRGFRYLFAETNYAFGGDIDDVDVSWPESDWPHYSWPFTETLYIPAESRWRWSTATFLHEFGHHVNYELPTSIAQTSTDDGNCESYGDPGRHCQWCGEDDLNVAYVEGFASWFGDMASLTFESTYGQKPYDLDGKLHNEQIGLKDFGTPCPGGNDGDRTEGYFWALLRDLADTNDEADSLYWVNQSGALSPDRADPEDRLSLGFADVLDVLADNDIITVAEFRSAFMQRYSPTLPATDLWNTFANAGYWYDLLPPSAVTNLHSSDHSPGVPSGDNSLAMVWNPATDSQSGVQLYRVRLWREGVPFPLFITTTDTPATTIPGLYPGNWSVSVQTIDLAGNPGAIVTSPTYTIRPATPSDLKGQSRAGWDDLVVARSTTGAGSGSAVVTPYLAGGKDSTWFSWSVYNAGEQPVGTTFRTRLVVDGVVLDSVQSSSFAGTFSQQHTVTNRGPYNIRPGRHTVELWTDAEEVIAEPDEANNRFGASYVWEAPSREMENTDLIRPAPPRRDAGLESFVVPPNLPTPYNCVSHEYSHVAQQQPFNSATWVAVEAWAPSTRGSAAPNYDLLLNYDDTDAIIGFSSWLVASTRAAGLTDAIITNATNTGESAWEVGVQNVNGRTEDYHLRVNRGSNLSVGGTLPVSLAANQMVAIATMSVPAVNLGRILVEAQRTAGIGQLHLAYLPPNTQFASLTQTLGSTVMDSTGRAILSLTASSTSSHLLVLWRDPADGTAPVSVTLAAQVKPCDLAVATPAGWAAPMVPRPTSDATVASALRPSVLYGDLNLTFVSLGRRNASDVNSPGHLHQLWVDEQLVYNNNSLGLLANTTYANPNLVIPIIPGGRHVLTQRLDAFDTVDELFETNNSYAEQYVWTPTPMAVDAPMWRRGQIGGITAGWEYCLPTDIGGLDADGVRMPLFDAASGVRFAAVAVAPRDTSDVDLELYLPATTAKNGFDVPQEDSNWGAGKTDFILVNFDRAARQPYDLGILRVSDDTTSYVTHMVTSDHYPATATTYGSFRMQAGLLIKLVDVDLPTGRHTFHLISEGTPVDYGMAVYDTERPFQDRSQGEERGWSYLNGPGGSEDIVFVCEQPTTVVIAVYKVGSSEVAKNGQYRITRTTNVTDATGGSAPVVTRLTGARPSPFVGSTSVAFELSRASEVTLEVYDLRGARVRTLATGQHAAGAHSVMWDGRDDAGRRAAAGVYLVRMASGGYAGRAKVVRVE